MEIKVQIKGVVYCLCFGHKTKWFSQRNFVTLCAEYYDDNMKVQFARLIY